MRPRSFWGVSTAVRFMKTIYCREILCLVSGKKITLEKAKNQFKITPKDGVGTVSSDVTILDGTNLFVTIHL